MYTYNISLFGRCGGDFADQITRLADAAYRQFIIYLCDLSDPSIPQKAMCGYGWHISAFKTRLYVRRMLTDDPDMYICTKWHKQRQKPVFYAGGLLKKILRLKMLDLSPISV